MTAFGNEPRTTHRLVRGDARDLSWIPDASVQLALTSPPYPLISMWDDQFATQDAVVARAFSEERAVEAFEHIHARILLPAWRELWRVLADGAFVCVNIGDAVRTLGGRFRLYPNGPRVLSDLHALGFDLLPQIIWRKTTNAPNKFMGSGMLPAGAYVTLEHEHILIARKGGPRVFADDAAREERRRSALFWEERNVWFSDLWDIRGVNQEIKAPAGPAAAVAGVSASPEASLAAAEPDKLLPARERSAAFPLELAERLVQMFSVRGDTVLDPFAGTLTATAAALGTGRNSIGVEAEPELLRHGCDRLSALVPELNRRVAGRVARHKAWAADYQARKPGGLRHVHAGFGCGVMTLQETLIEPVWVASIAGADDGGGGKRLRAEHRPYQA